MELSGPINAIKDIVARYIDNTHGSAQAGKSPLEEFFNVDFDSTAITQILQLIYITSKLDVTEADEEVKNESLQLNTLLTTQAKDFCFTMAVSLVADVFLDEMRRSYSEEEPEKLYFKNFETNSGLLKATEKICLLLDLLIHLQSSSLVPAAKSTFYLVLQTVLETLLSISPELTELFWIYMESHILIIKSHIFDANVTQDRIAMLKICNGLTDRNYERNSSGKFDSYNKDSFNDRLHARVRIFATNVFNFDDATGLNKLLILANRTNKEPHLGTSKSSDGHLLREILSFQRLLRDPYTFLKNPRLLTSQVDSMSRLSTYFLDEEGKYSKVHPPRDLFAIESDNLDPETIAAQLPVFSPETYWLSVFVATQSGDEFDALRKKDEEIASKRFDQSNFRKLLIVQIFMVCCFFSELQASRKQAALTTAEVPFGAKHIIDETTPETLAIKIQKMKKDIIRLIRPWNPSFSYLLQHVSHSEEYWWSWLIDGRQKNGSKLIPMDCFSEEFVVNVQLKFDAIASFKTKRYFNSHATPHLSKRMKVKTGLDLLSAKKEATLSDGDELERVNKELEIETDEQTRESLLEQKNMLIWKSTKALRDANWLELDEHLSVDDLIDAKAEERRKAQEIEAQQKITAERDAAKTLEGPEDTAVQEMEVDEALQDVEQDTNATGEKPDSDYTGQSSEERKNGIEETKVDENEIEVETKLDEQKEETKLDEQIEEEEETKQDEANEEEEETKEVGERENSNFSTSLELASDNSSGTPSCETPIEEAGNSKSLEDLLDSDEGNGTTEVRDGETLIETGIEESLSLASPAANGEQTPEAEAEAKGIKRRFAEKKNPETKKPKNETSKEMELA